MHIYHVMCMCLIASCIYPREGVNKRIMTDNEDIKRLHTNNKQQPEIPDSSRLGICSRIATGMTLGVLESAVTPLVMCIILKKSGINIINMSFVTSVASYILYRLSRTICYHDTHFHASHIISSWLLHGIDLMNTQSQKIYDFQRNVCRVSCFAGTLPSIQYFLEKNHASSAPQ